MENPANPAGAASSKEKLSEAQKNIQKFWPNVMREMQAIRNVEPGNQVLPLARIKKIMKLDEDVKMISSDAPLLFAKAIEIFIHELTLRAWLHTEHNKRRTLQRSDIAMAISKYDQFDFLIDIVPRDDIKVGKKDFAEMKAGGVAGDDIQYYFQLAQQHQHALQQQHPPTATALAVAIAGVNTATTTTTATKTVAQVTNGASIVQLKRTNQSQAPSYQQIPLKLSQGLQGITFANASVVTSSSSSPSSVTANSGTNQALQLFQQVMTASGEITQIPISIPQNQLSFIRAAGVSATATTTGTGQPIFLQTTSSMQAGPAVIHTAPTGVFLSTSQFQQLQQQQTQQQQSQQHRSHHQQQQENHQQQQD
ncbi:nuclear transcription factor Y subunit gamma isoform X2 [Anopheles cruzii]|uniref:nuclear transcription factor Y subunit gamma isoform X2 n=1 Tax=Anopheles cruzii TaxID=68878 RepID=UPI0022EC4A09|nr:nuclear transcription factor Y subunit gamma isoform X2 [Anopheles cruzii]